MEKLKFIKPEKIILKFSQEYSEKWVQDIIANDPQILGLGDLILKDKERKQPTAGRLDLLLQDSETNRRYEVEIQLGKTDESHIIRTLEYWDIERKRFPQYDHCAVIVAEEITSRFLNVISLFNGSIPLIAIQMNALKFENGISLSFTTVLDELNLGLDESDEEQEVTDRNYWETKGTKQTVALADEMLNIIKEFDSRFELKYNKFYIGLSKEGIPQNFAIFRARKKHLGVAVRLKKLEEIDSKLEESNLDVLDYNKRSGRYRFNIDKEDLQKNKEMFTWIIRMAYESSNL